MKTWLVLLGGLVVWAAHFFAVYAIASALPGRSLLASGLVLAALAAAVIANVMVLGMARRAAEDALDRWAARIGRGGAVLSILAVTWQSVPALIR